MTVFSSVCVFSCIFTSYLGCHKLPTIVKCALHERHGLLPSGLLYFPPYCHIFICSLSRNKDFRPNLQRDSGSAVQVLLQPGPWGLSGFHMTVCEMESVHWQHFLISERIAPSSGGWLLWKGCGDHFCEVPHLCCAGFRMVTWTADR